MPDLPDPLHPGSETLAPDETPDPAQLSTSSASSKRSVLFLSRYTAAGKFGYGSRPFPLHAPDATREEVFTENAVQAHEGLYETFVDAHNPRCSEWTRLNFTSEQVAKEVSQSLKVSRETGNAGRDSRLEGWSVQVEPVKHASMLADTGSVESLAAFLFAGQQKGPYYWVKDKNDGWEPMTRAQYAESLALPAQDEMAAAPDGSHRSGGRRNRERGGRSGRSFRGRASR